MPDTTPGTTAAATALAAPLRLRSGLVLPNRLVKAAMTEGLADRDRPLVMDVGGRVDHP